jgi:hypothetical protein
MMAYVAGCTYEYLATLKLRLVSSAVVDLTDAEFKLPLLPASGFSLSSATHIWIYLDYDYFCLCST